MATSNNDRISSAKLSTFASELWKKVKNTFLKKDGSNGTDSGVSALINKLTTDSSTPVDGDYYVSQYVNGGTSTTSFHRRPVSALWSYIKGKMTSDSGVNISGNSATSDYVKILNTNEVNFKNVPTSGNKQRLWFNYINGDTGERDSGNKITEYFFGNRDASTDGVSLHADTFVGNATSATTANKSNAVKGSSSESISYVTGDTHVIQLGYITIPTTYSSIELMVNHGFYNNQHYGSDLLHIFAHRPSSGGQSGNNNVAVTRTVLSAQDLYGQSRAYYALLDNANNRLYIYAEIKDNYGNGYGIWNVTPIGNNVDFNAVFAGNVDKRDLSEIPITGHVYHAMYAGSAINADNANNAVSAQKAVLADIAERSYSADRISNVSFTIEGSIPSSPIIIELW